LQGRHPREAGCDLEQCASKTRWGFRLPDEVRDLDPHSEVSGRHLARLASPDGLLERGRILREGAHLSERGCLTRLEALDGHLADVGYRRFAILYPCRLI